MQPLRHRDRYAPLDVLRGLALYGVLIVNLLTLFRVSLFAHITGADQPPDALGGFIASAVGVLVEFKAFTLFSFLFGVGAAVQAERVGKWGSVPLFLLRRFAVLLVFGLIHLYLVWNGDILALYAICGLLLIPLLGVSVPWIAGIGASLIAASALGAIPVHLPETAVLQAHAAEATRVYSSGTFLEILAFRWRETNQLIAPLLVMTLPRTLGVMMLGAAAWRSEILTARRSLWIPILAACTLAGVAGSLFHADPVAQIGLAFAYAAAVLLWVPNVPLIAAGGQMALTNYLTQSIVCGFVFYGYGFGLFGRVGVGEAAAGGTVFYLAQLALSRWWLQRFEFGPFEWVWRSLTYGYRQPMLRGGAFTLSHSGIRMAMVLIFLVAVPLIHIGVPWALSGWGPHWGWSAGGAAGVMNQVGLGLITCGIAILIWLLTAGLREIRHMPERVSISLRPERLMQSGPYAWSRHPMYLAEGLLWAGVGVYTGSPVVMAVLVVGAIFARVVIVPREERALESSLGEVYRDYRRRVPGVTDFRRHPPPALSGTGKIG